MKQQPAERSSRLPGFYRKSISERTELIARWAGLTPEEAAQLHAGLSLPEADTLIENVVGLFTLPLGIGTNFRINGVDVLAPMVVEEPSVVAAVSNAAKLARVGGGFVAGSTDPVMIGQVQLMRVPDAQAATARIQAAEAELLALANTSPTIARLGGGPKGLEVHRWPETPAGPMLVVHLLFDCRDAMGANAVNTAVETLAPRLEALSGGDALLRILSNYSDRRRSWASVWIPLDALAGAEQDGWAVGEGIAAANALAWVDPYRATTHNKGIFNGIDALLMATGNDWRAVEAGGHAYAARDGRYRALTHWRVLDSADDARGAVRELVATEARAGVAQSIPADDAFPLLFGHLDLPLSVGIVGGATRSHPTARIALRILGVERASELAEIGAAVGLAQNLAALRALVTSGIQHGHMRLHARQIAAAAGAPAEAVDAIAAQLVAEGEIRVERARELLAAGSAQ